MADERTSKRYRVSCYTCGAIEPNGRVVPLVLGHYPKEPEAYRRAADHGVTSGHVVVDPVIGRIRRRIETEFVPSE